MIAIRFPTDRVGGTVECDGSWTDERGPVLETGAIEVPDGVPVALEVQVLIGSEPTGGGSWSISSAQHAAHFGFLRRLPSDVVESVSVHNADETTLDAFSHIALGLRRLYLGWTGFSDAVLSTVATLTGLTYLQTFGNDFTDRGVQQLASLVNLEHLYLEEETLTVDAFDFVEHLPNLTRLGVQDVPLDERDLHQLRQRLPNVDIG